MVFNSASFLGFFLIVFLGYWSLRGRWRMQNHLLLLASYVFYAFWDWRFPALMAITTVVDYVMTGLMRSSPDKRKAYLWISLASNLGVLFALKYFNFFQDNVISVLGQLGVEASPLFTGIFLPVGISFYTFQRLTFVIDAYREPAREPVGLPDFALFVSFFPLLLSGPIERAKQFMPQLLGPRVITAAHIEEGLWLVSWGLFKKVFVADNLAVLVNPVFAEDWHGSGGHALVALYAYAFQIYCDFSGYSDVAKGIARLLGFDVRWNFNLPYFATNPSDFWRRWHISLSTWLRDYVFIPLGGSWGGTWRTARNLMATMALVGLWHGAAWNYIVWGLYHGLLLTGYRAMLGGDGKKAPRSVWTVVPSILLMFHLTCLGWLLFRVSSLHQAWHLLSVMASGISLPDVSATALWNLSGYVALLLAVQLFQLRKGSLFVLERAPVAVKGIAYGALFYLTVLHGGTSNSFIYFQF